MRIIELKDKLAISTNDIITILSNVPVRVNDTPYKGGGINGSVTITRDTDDTTPAYLIIVQQYQIGTSNVREKINIPKVTTTVTKHCTGCGKNKVI